MSFDPRLTFLLLVFATVFSFGQAIWALVGARNTRRAVNRRLATAERAGSLGELVLELRKQRGLTEDGQGRSHFLADLIVRSGLKYEPRKWALYAGALAVAGLGLTSS